MTVRVRVIQKISFCLILYTPQWEKWFFQPDLLRKEAYGKKNYYILLWFIV